MRLVRITFDVRHDEPDIECLESIFDSLRCQFGESTFAKAFASFITVEKLLIDLKSDLKNEKKHKKVL